MRFVRLAAVTVSMLVWSNFAVASQEYFRCLGGKGDNYINVLGAVDRATSEIRVGAGTTRSRQSGQYESVLVTGRAVIRGSVIGFSGTGQDDFASGSLDFGSVKQPASWFYSAKFETLPLTCKFIETPDLGKVCSGRWRPCLNLLNEHSCCYEAPR